MISENLVQDNASDPRIAKNAGRRMRSRSALWSGVLVLIPAVILAGCVSPQPPPQAPPVEGYVVGPPDLLSIYILPEPEIVREVRVRPDGKISVDLIGDVQAAGRTPFEIAQAIQQEIRRFKRDASVNVTVVDSPSQFVTVYGEVMRPGTFPLTTETRISEAIGQVGGTRPFASLNRVRVIRTNGARTEVIRIRLGDIQRGDLSTNLVVQEGDLIVVPPTAIARVGYFVQMLLFPFQPLLTTAGAVGGTAAGVRAF